MLEFLSKPWPWYIAGPLIGLTVPILLIIGNKSFGLSSSLKHICAVCLPTKLPFFDYDWKSEAWNLFFVFGITLGGFIAYVLFPNPQSVVLHQDLVTDLMNNGIVVDHSLLPTTIFSWTNLFSFKGFVFIILGGFLVGFGTRYADGCTSGHAIMGLSTLQWPSLVATCCFMLSGYLVANFLMPYLLTL